MRNLDAAVLAELPSRELRMALLAEIDFASGVERLWAGPAGHALEFDGETYVAVGDIGEIDKISEADGLADGRTTVSLRVDGDSVSGPIGSDDSRGRDFILRLVLLTQDGEPIGEIPFRKTMGRLRIEASARDEGDARIIDERLSLELLDETSTLGRSHTQRMSYEAGLRIDSDDHGLEFVSDPDVSNTGNVRDFRFDRGGPGRGDTEQGPPKMMR